MLYHKSIVRNLRVVSTVKLFAQLQGLNFHLRLSLDPFVPTQQILHAESRRVVRHVAYTNCLLDFEFFEGLDLRASQICAS